MDERKLANIVIRHTIASERRSRGEATRIVKLLDTADQELVDKLAARYSAIVQAGYDRGPATTKRLNDMLEAIRKVNASVYKRLRDGLHADLIEVARHETDFAQAAGKSAGIDHQTTIPSSDFLKSLVENSPISGALFNSWTQGLEDGRYTRLEQAIRSGLVQGETTDQIVRRIAGSRANSYQDGILNISRRSATTFAITANATVQNEARLEVFRNMAAISYVEWSSILDGRTSAICQSLSGKIFNINEAHPTPPAHMRCRSILLPRQNDIGNRHQPFGDWLRDQPDDVHEEVLGTHRAKIFRANPKFDFHDFFRKDNSYKTLDQLKAFDKHLVAK